MYGVYHIYDVDGGFGDAVEKEDLICVFENQIDAVNFKCKYENPHVYDDPYTSLFCGKLETRLLPEKANPDTFWWLKNTEKNNE